MSMINMNYADYKENNAEKKSKAYFEFAQLMADAYPLN
jgi:hypothetical protein